MLDAKTISATLLVGLLGCASGPDANTEDGSTSASTATTSAPTSDIPPENTGTPPTTASAVTSAEVKPAALPMGRAEPLPPMDKKPIASKDKSVRKGSEACCGEGTCGPCKPLPGKATAPKAPKDGKMMPASQSKRTGKESCCGEGTCGPC